MQGKWFQNILDFLYPVQCINCHKKGEYLCQDCLALIDLLNNPISPKQETKFLNKIYAATLYKNELVKQAIHLFKYPPYLKEMGKPLSKLIINYFYSLDKKIEFQNSVFVPIPLHKTSLKKRGFNQAEILAHHLSKEMNIPLLDILIKIKKTHPQMSLKREERQKNIINAFAIKKGSKERITGRNIFLIDDVFTTGATMNEAAKILKENGAKNVYGIVVAIEE